MKEGLSKQALAPYAVDHFREHSNCNEIFLFLFSFSLHTGLINH